MGVVLEENIEMDVHEYFFQETYLGFFSSVLRFIMQLLIFF